MNKGNYKQNKNKLKQNHTNKVIKRKITKQIKIN